MKRIMIKKELCTACMAEHNSKSKFIYLLNMLDKENESRNQIVIGRNGKNIPIFIDIVMNQSVQTLV